MQNEKVLNLIFNETKAEIKLFASCKFRYQAAQL